MSENLNLLAFDCGNSTVRTILSHYDGEKITSQILQQEPNEMLEGEDGYIYWDLGAIFDTMKRGLAKAAQITDHIDSVGICTWGVDFQLLDARGEFLGRTFCYRNSIGEEEISRLSDSRLEEMFFDTGIIGDKINSVFMLRGLTRRFPEMTRKAAKLLMVPDAMVYLFTGELVNEPSDLSTTQMMNVSEGCIDEGQCRYAGVSPSLFCKVPEHGTKVGMIRKEILSEAGIDYDIPVICVPSHDTACAVTGIPAGEEEFLFVSSGTWALIGAHMAKPVITKQAMRSHLTNEMVAFGHITLLRNSAGMYILQRLRSEYMEQTGHKVSWTEFTKLAEEWSGPVLSFDVNKDRFFNPKRMSDEIHRELHPEQCRESVSDTPAGGRADGNANPRVNWAELIACSQQSLADCCADALQNVRDCTGRVYDKVYIVGGGSRNISVNRRIAQRMQLPVIACDMECSSVGNAVVQLKYFHPEFSYSDLRAVVCRSLQVTSYAF